MRYKFLASVIATDTDIHSMSSARCSYLNLLLLSFVVIMQIHLPCCVYAGSFMEFQCFEVKPEGDNNDMPECQHDDKPSAGMLLLLLVKICFCIFLMCLLFVCSMSVLTSVHIV